MTHTNFGYSFSDLSRERRERELTTGYGESVEQPIARIKAQTEAADAKFDKQIDGEVVR